MNKETQLLWDHLSHKINQLPPKTGLKLTFSQLTEDTGLTRKQLLTAISYLHLELRYIEPWILSSDTEEEGVQDSFQIDPLINQD